MSLIQSNKVGVLKVTKPVSAMLAGTIQPFAGDTSGWSVVKGVKQKNGWAVLEGDVLEQADYPELYANIGAAWNSFAHPVDGTPTVGGSQFALPNLKGLFLGGAGSNGDSTFTLGTYAADTFESHTHDIRSGGGSGSTFRFTGSATYSSSSFATTTEGAGGSETRPKTAPVVYIIALYDNIAANSLGLPAATATQAGTVSREESGTVDLTLNGFTDNSAITCEYQVVGKKVTIEVPSFSRTSNTTTFHINLPASLQRSSNSVWAVYGRPQDNGSFLTTATYGINASGYVDMRSNDAAGSWTASGAKGLGLGVRIEYLLD